MLHVVKFRLTGFKSFVDMTEVTVMPGMTGIVGPNGCGKSNLVEALRWVMGESSARMLRGDEMDDVIFAGTGGRPPRGFAEVVLQLDNQERSAPPPYTACETIEVSRRIERGRGSVYRVNGREVRARDVQLLFADQASGARSSAIVTQGQVASLIGAKPAERRGLLEEAAGIAGLQTRRHETELRLNAAEANLQRADDTLATLRTQQQRLAEQVRQADHYRTLSERIRKTEAAILGADWKQVVGLAEAARQEAQHVAGRVAEAAALVAGCAAALADAEAALPRLRDAQAEAAVERHHLQAERDAVEAEERRLEQERHACRQRGAQLADDLTRAQQGVKDAETSLQRLHGERERLIRAGTGEEERLSAAAAELATLDSQIAVTESDFLALSERTAAAAARRDVLARSLDDMTRQQRRLDDRSRALAQQHERNAGETAAAAAAAARAETELADAAETLAHVQRTAAAAEVARAAAQAALAPAEAMVQEANTAHARLHAEFEALQGLARAEPRGGTPVLDLITVEPGYEPALAAALGEDLLVPADPDAPVHWRTLPAAAEDAPLPDMATPLARYCHGAPMLARRLAHIGVIDDEAVAERLQPHLKPGQRLVGRAGAVWRWDGLVQRSAHEGAISVRLRQRRRLAELPPLVAKAAAARTAAQARLAAARRDEAAARTAEQELRTGLRAAERTLERCRVARAEAAGRRDSVSAQTAVLADHAAALDAERLACEASLAAAATALAALPELAAERARVAGLRDELNSQRARQAGCRSALDGLRREITGRKRRVEGLQTDTAGWQQRLAAAEQQVASLSERHEACTAEQRRLDAAPGELEARRQQVLDTLMRAEAIYAQVADALAVGEEQRRTADSALRRAEGTEREAREARIRAEAATQQAGQEHERTTQRIAERLGVAPEELATLAAAPGSAADAQGLQRRFERLQREREAMGPVNLRANEEAAALADQVAALETQRADLEGAIAKLRRAISEIDGAARERLLAAFTEVSRHFHAVFTRLFGGGRAELALTTPDDPLTAGLEVRACPPGKKLQSLALLSGGEQALTGLALRFAQFLTKPTPLCVLDEVDAALDDANVNRLCLLLNDLAVHGTRFLVITHHRMTMARSDRLFGLTMPERGVSQLVSVDLRPQGSLAPAASHPPLAQILAARSVD
ncbi:Chromosome partition protein Smc [uncultured Defluviicoccus sp.]|uniref:Chromosome partition protein Smc n=1 Tax=metagenome TaxID=256318 RepID=A0A380T9I9_9ZZZZ|nr:Chromosome partition protein Smc [uncultured Defluviicoccus sp.]